ncbi:XRE family transcriptional regulator [Streptococcus mitis]|uniref:Phage CI-like repressor n=1 Tax=Streptococcus mitis TaxID=28037 RepID=A0A139Q8N8_STRMT|nr:S24 family peptidase [Streptococcus mitis]KXT98925.1 Phage CI-like repressor [Streptococcus mitis]
MNILGNSIKEIRKSKKMTQNELSQLTGFKQNTISNHENGKRQLDETDIRIYAAALEVEPQQLFSLSKVTTPTASPDSLTQQITDKVVQLTPDNKKIVLRTSEELLERQKANGEMYTEQNEEETKINEVSENIIRLDDYRQTTYRRVTGVVSAGSGSMQDDDLDMEVSFYEDEIPDDYDAIAYVVGNSMEPKIKNGDYLFIKNTPQVDYNTIGIFQVDGANYVKKLRQGYLESLNPDYEDIHLDESNDVRTIGEVVSIYREN